MQSGARRLHTQVKIGDYEVLQDKEAKEDLFRAIRKEDEYRSFCETAIQTALLADIGSDHFDGSERLRSLLKPFIGRYRSFFDNEDLFEEFRDEFVEEEVQDAEEAMNRIERVVQGEDPEDVFDSVATQVKYKQMLEEI